MSLDKCKLTFFTPSRSNFHPDVTSRLEENLPVSFSEEKKQSKNCLNLPFVLSFFWNGGTFSFQLTSMHNPASALELPPCVCWNKWMDVLSEEGFVCATHTERCYLSHKGLFILCTPKQQHRSRRGPFARTSRLFCQSRAERSGAEWSGRSLKVIHQNVSPSLGSAAVTTLPRWISRVVPPFLMQEESDYLPVNIHPGAAAGRGPVIYGLE